jgi:hypothetical protein
MLLFVYDAFACCLVLFAMAYIMFRSTKPSVCVCVCVCVATVDYCFVVGGPLHEARLRDC